MGTCDNGSLDVGSPGCWGWPTRPGPVDDVAVGDVPRGGCVAPWGRLIRGIDIVGTPGHTLVAADLEDQQRAVRVADIDPLAVLDVDHRHATVVDVHPVEAAVVDGDPSALVESQQQMSPGDQGVPDADVRPQVTPNNHIVARCEGTL